MTTLRFDREEAVRLVIQEVYEAKDVLELVEQLAPALPIKGFDDIRKAAGENDSITFRGTRFKLYKFEGQIPDELFPIEDLQTLVERVATVVRAVPDYTGLNPENPEHARRLLRRSDAFGQQPYGRSSVVLTNGPVGKLTGS